MYFILKHMEGAGNAKILFNLYPKFLHSGNSSILKQVHVSFYLSIILN